MINVWVKDGVREKIIEKKLLNDPNFKLTSLMVNPLYKPVFDSLDAKAVKMLNELDKSVLWSRRYTKQTFKYTFFYPLIMFTIVIFCCLNIGVKRRIYMNYIRHGRKLELAERMDLDLDDFENYPPSVYYEYRAKMLYDKQIERKEEQIKKVEERFHAV